MVKNPTEREVRGGDWNQRNQEVCCCRRRWPPVRAQWPVVPEREHPGQPEAAGCLILRGPVEVRCRASVGTAAQHDRLGFQTGGLVLRLH